MITRLEIQPTEDLLPLRDWITGDTQEERRTVPWRRERHLSHKGIEKVVPAGSKFGQQIWNRVISTLNNK